MTILHKRVLPKVIGWSIVIGISVFPAMNTVFCANAQTPPEFLFLFTTIRPSFTSGVSTESTSESTRSSSSSFEATSHAISRPTPYSAEPMENFHPIHQSVRAGDLDKTRSLISAGANVNQKTATGKTPLHLAVLTRDTPMVEALLENGADVTTRDVLGKVPVDYWEADAGDEMLRLLVSRDHQHGSLPTSQNKRRTGR